jgi:radical SAM superfamily enzyme YgiQ (UPF0313 family)
LRVLLISTYDLGRQPFGLASPAAWLQRAGHRVTCADLAVNGLPVEELRAADVVAFHLPMHTATRMAAPLIAEVRELNPAARIACYGLYAPLNAEYLRSLGVMACLGGEFEAALVDFVNGEGGQDRLAVTAPARTGLPPLARYAKLHHGTVTKVVGYTEASRGCKHLCRHCPVVPVYEGKFRVVQADVVLADVRQQVEAGAAHITFGDPDFFNGPTHAVRVVEALHREHPGVSYDVTIKVEHLLAHRELIPRLKATGCLFVTSAVESLDDAVLAKLDKGHTRADFVEALRLLRAAGLYMKPTFIPFTPWTTLESYAALREALEELHLTDHVAPIQLALRLLIPQGSRLLELAEIQQVIEGWDGEALLYRWRHRDARVDELAAQLMAQAAALEREAPPRRSEVPYLDEPWYC